MVMGWVRLGSGDPSCGLVVTVMSIGVHWLRHSHCWTLQMREK